MGRYTSVEHMVGTQPPAVQQALCAADALIVDTLPGVLCLLRWDTPFYFLNGPLCYLSTPKAGGIELAFPRATLLPRQYQAQLQAMGRKLVMGLHLPTDDAVWDREQMCTLLLAAAQLNESNTGGWPVLR